MGRFNYIYRMKMTFYLLLALSIRVTCVTHGQIRITDDLYLMKITQNAYLHVSFADSPPYGRVSANGLIFTNGSKAFLFDTPWNDTLTSCLANYLTGTMGLTIEGFVPNHWHSDCMGGLGYILSKGIKTYGNKLTSEIAAREGLPQPETGFTDSLHIMLGDTDICLFFPGPAHSTDNIVTWIPSEAILFPGCMCRSAESDNLGYTADGDLSTYRKTIENVTKRFCGAKIVIPGHGDTGGMDLLQHTISLCSK